MSKVLPIIFTKNFEYNFTLIPKKDQDRIHLDLTHMNRQDILRQGKLQGPLNYLRKMNNGDYRIFLAYCKECFNEFRDRISCTICDENELERIIAFFIYPRKKLYQPRRFKKVDITRIEFY